MPFSLKRRTDSDKKVEIISFAGTINSEDERQIFYRTIAMSFPKGNDKLFLNLSEVEISEAAAAALSMGCYEIRKFWGVIVIIVPHDSARVGRFCPGARVVSDLNEALEVLRSLV